MFRIAVVLALALAIPCLASAARKGGPPGGAAPKSLLGTWRTTLTRAELAKTTLPDATRTYELVVVNGKYLSYARALGLRPAGSGGDTVPFSVVGHNLLLSCLNGQGAPASGYATYSWTITGKTLRFKLAKEPCQNKALRNRIIVLTSEPWHRAA